jgi:hypothetical protein
LSLVCFPGRDKRGQRKRDKREREREKDREKRPR